MYKIPLMLILWASTTILPAQGILWQESFETDGNLTRYDVSSIFYDGTNDYFVRTDGSGISIIGSVYSNYNGSYFWAGEDHDDTGDPANDGLAAKEIIFNTINSSSYTNLQFSGLFAAGHDGGSGLSAYDDEDSVTIYYSTDGGINFFPALRFASTGDQSNEPIAWDTDFDGIGDSTILTPLFSEFKFDLPDADSIIIKITVSMNAGSEEFAFDHFQITGTPNGTAPLPTKVFFTSSADTISESQNEYLLGIHVENISDTVEVEISLSSGDSSDIASFDRFLITSDTADTILYATLFLNDNMLIDGNKQITFSIKNVSGGYLSEIKEPSTFDLFIEDDDKPVGGEVIISEIMYDSKSSTDEEWIELYNTTSNPINISGWYLTDDDSYPADAEGDLVFPDSTFIKSGEYLIVTWKPLSDYSDALVLDKNTGSRNYAPGLINGGDNLALYSNAYGTGILVDGSDSIPYDDASSANSGYSIERDIINGYAGDWKPSVNNYYGVEITKGTPGEINSTYYTSVAFELAEKVISEDSGSVFINLIIDQPSDTVETEVKVQLFSGDSLKIDAQTSRQIIFHKGSSDPQSLMFTIYDDSTVANIDTLIFKITRVSGGNRSYIESDSVFQLIILDNDFTEVNFVSDSIEIKEGDSLQIELSITNPHPDIKTDFALTTSESDISLKNNLYSFEVGQERDLTTIWLYGVYDAVEEGDEYVELKISEVTGGNLGAAGKDSIIVVKVIDDNPTQVSFVDSAGMVSESEGSYLIPVTIKYPSSENPTIAEISLESGDSTDLSNFYRSSVTFPAGDDSLKYVEVSLKNDLIRENQEVFEFKIITVSGGNKSVMGRNTFILTITDNEAPARNIILNEFLYDPPADSILGDVNGDSIRHSSQDEFIEIVNVDSMAVDLQGFTIHDASGVRHLFPAGSVLNPHQAIVIFGGGTPIGLFGESIIQTASTGTLSLNNTGDDILLINGADTLINFRYDNSRGKDQSVTRYRDLVGDFLDHASTSAALYSPGYQSNGLRFDEKWPDPEIFLDVSSFSSDFGLIYFGDTSEVKKYSINAEHLEDTLYIKAPVPFEVSVDSVHWENKIKLYQRDSFTSKIFIRIIPSSSDSIIYNDHLIHYTLNTDTIYLTVTAESRKIPEPKILLNVEEHDFGGVVYEQDVSIFKYSVTGKELVDDVRIQASSGFTISADSSHFSEQIILTPGPFGKIDTFLYVLFQPQEVGSIMGTLVHSSTDTDTVELLLRGEKLLPFIQTDLDSINFSQLVVNDISEVFAVHVMAESLADEIIITPPSGFQVSMEENFINQSDTLHLYPSANRKIDTTLFIRFLPKEVKDYSGDLIISSYGAETKNVNLTGKSLLPEISVSETILDFGISISEDFVIKKYRIKGQSLIKKVVVSAPARFTLSLSSNFSEHSSELLINAVDNKVDTTIYVGFQSANEVFKQDYISHYSYGSDTIKLEVKGERVEPQLFQDTKSLDFGEIALGEVSDMQQYEIMGTSLMDTVFIISPNGFEMDLESFFNNPTDSMVLIPKDRLINKKIFIRFNPAEEGIYTDSILHFGRGLDSTFLLLKGSSYKVTGLSSKTKNSISIYPNPAKEILNVKFYKNNGPFDIQLINILGEIVFTSKADQDLKINTSLYKPGIYLLKIKGSNNHHIYKILIDHL